MDDAMVDVSAIEDGSEHAVSSSGCRRPSELSRKLVCCRLWLVVQNSVNCVKMGKRDYKRTWRTIYATEEYLAR